MPDEEISQDGDMHAFAARVLIDEMFVVIAFGKARREFCTSTTGKPCHSMDKMGGQADAPTRQLLERYQRLCRACFGRARPGTDIVGIH